MLGKAIVYMIISPDLHKVSLQCVGILWLCCLSGSAHLLKAHSFSLCHHYATVTRLSEAGSPFSWTVRSFFVPPILYLIDRGQRTEKGAAAKEATSA